MACMHARPQPHTTHALAKKGFLAYKTDGGAR